VRDSSCRRKSTSALSVFVFASDSRHQTVGGGKVVPIRTVLAEIFTGLKKKRLYNSTVPEHLSILRRFQFAAEYRDVVLAALGSTS
jgi:hypothetical protein